ncbi:MAG: trypsin-like peptidase domain-containing protein [Planctomycetes bacterium]|nr:trypsin-like peptidase domain-containing protein [Planctomycetota bacterium]MCL4728819.1 S1C family serine protease [Planctomycetota bacterium]
MRTYVLGLVVAGALLFLQDTDVAAVKLADTVLDLKPGVAAEVTLPADTAILQGFVFEVPREAKALYLVVSDANADIDMLLVRGRKAKDYDDLSERVVAESMTGRVNETLRLAEDTEPPLKPGKWWVYAGTLSPEADEEVTFKLTLAFDNPPLRVPGVQVPFRAMAGLSPKERAIDSCVRLDTDWGTGSGTVVTPGGLILTCLHVLEGEDKTPVKEGIYVSFTQSPRRVAQQTHLAKLVESDSALDLALVQIVADMDGKPVDKPQFTWLPLAKADPELDDDLRCLGYPAIGGARTLCSISLTRGVVSGFVERKGRLVWLKSDCLISAGNSGGTAVNARWELQAVPTEAIHDSDTMEGMGYLRPVSALPQTWRDRIAEVVK